MGAARIPLDVSAPPITALLCLLLALVPISALFSALALAIAAFARSSKEGHYYLVPLLMLSLPLMMLSIVPGAELDLGFSLIPLTGLLLWLRALIEGQYLDVLRFSVPVLGMTAVCCFCAIRWAVSQFNNESVLFRESERFDLVLWLRQLRRNRAAREILWRAGRNFQEQLAARLEPGGDLAKLADQCAKGKLSVNQAVARIVDFWV